ncbi:MAG: GDP/UDP-N,N'-diacetylbacillosamine 2-epimerase (hydrolyzing) [Algoriphagus sp.]|jgi:GDP/UDP-N,N'-diacetylbacillosamine 2-epimerase (hydrolysing)
MKIGVLTSSRADYGIYRPLLEKLAGDKRFELFMIAFGMHLQEKHGKTIAEIERDAFGKIVTVDGMPSGDSRKEVAEGYGELIKSFSGFWFENKFDCVLTLGDRWEMSAAVQASIPFEVNLAHIHGGETTLGATDNIYRHQISLASTLHFTAAQEFAERIIEITKEVNLVYTVGSISLESIDTMTLPKWGEVSNSFNIPFDRFILVTVHPESVNANRNQEYAEEIFNTLTTIAKLHCLLITKANADVMGSIFNNRLEQLAAENPNKIRLVASLGKANYFSAMRQCDFLLGNTSSGIIEAASFGKWVINLGDRQKGRLRSNNILDVSFNHNEILEALNEIESRNTFTGVNKYVQVGTTDKIVKALLEL